MANLLVISSFAAFNSARDNVPRRSEMFRYEIHARKRAQPEATTLIGGCYDHFARMQAKLSLRL